MPANHGICPLPPTSTPPPLHLPNTCPLSVPCPPLQEKIICSFGRAHGCPEEWGLTGELGTGPPPDRGPTKLESAEYRGLVAKATCAGPTLPNPVPFGGMPAAAPFASDGMPATAAAALTPIIDSTELIAGKVHLHNKHGR